MRLLLLSIVSVSVLLGEAKPEYGNSGGNYGSENWGNNNGRPDSNNGGNYGNGGWNNNNGYDNGNSGGNYGNENWGNNNGRPDSNNGGNYGNNGNWGHDNGNSGGNFHNSNNGGRPDSGSGGNYGSDNSQHGYNPGGYHGREAPPQDEGADVGLIVGVTITVLGVIVAIAVGFVCYRKKYRSVPSNEP